jgi:hypothetical protein
VTISGAGEVSEAQLRRSAILRDLCDTTEGAGKLDVTAQDLIAWQQHVDECPDGQTSLGEGEQAVQLWLVRPIDQTAQKSPIVIPSLHSHQASDRTNAPYCS